MLLSVFNYKLGVLGGGSLATFWGQGGDERVLLETVGPASITPKLGDKVSVCAL